MTEDINGVLNAGDVPGLYKIEDAEEIMTCGRKRCQQNGIPVTKMNMNAQYIISVRQNIHVIFAMSPMGETFQMRLRMFPSLINCCTIDWFTNWPAEALLNVARGSIADEADMNLNEDEEGVIEMFRVIHQSVEVKVGEFWDEYRRRSYVTPTSFLELLTTYKKILIKERADTSKSKRRYERGLKILETTAAMVADLQEELTVKQPALEVK
jgi:dynein heavy chain